MNSPQGWDNVISESDESVHFKSDKQDWETPRNFYQVVAGDFDISADLAATAETCKHPTFISPEQDSLKSSWKEWVRPRKSYGWLNPPYGRELPKWVEKAYKEWKSGVSSVLLLPARPDTKYWHKYILPYMGQCP